MITVEDVDSAKLQYSDDEKTTTTTAGNESKHTILKSSLKTRSSKSIGQPRRKLRFTAYDEGKELAAQVGFFLVTRGGIWYENILYELPHGSFSEFSVVEIPHINDLTPDEIFDCWMTNEDHQRIRQECLGAVGEVGDEKVSDGMLLRGLDQHTNRYKETRDYINQKVYDAVFAVQSFERENNVDCSELMAQLSAKYSEPSVISAQTAALSDLFSSFKGTWTHRSIPTIPEKLESGTWGTMTGRRGAEEAIH